MSICPTCKGKKKLVSELEKKCPNCDGYGIDESRERCPVCHGDGTIIESEEKTCPTCHGRGCTLEEYSR
jgi:DnaJ-class molecular chaperone